MERRFSPSPQFWPRSSPYRPPSHAQPERAKLQAPSLTCASRPGRAVCPLPQPPLHRLSPGSRPQSPAVGTSGRGRLRQEAKLLTWLLRLLASPPRLRPLFSCPPIRNLSRGPAPPSPPDARIRCSGRRSPALIESS